MQMKSWRCIYLRKKEGANVSEVARSAILAQYVGYGKMQISTYCGCEHAVVRFGRKCTYRRHVKKLWRQSNAVGESSPSFDDTSILHMLGGMSR